MLAEDSEIEYATLRDRRAQQHRDDAHHGLGDPSEDEAVHEQAEVDGLESPKKCSRTSAIADFDELHVGQDCRAPPVAGEEEDRHHAADAERPPDPVSGDSLLGNHAANKQRRVRGKGRGHHGGPGQPPRDISAGHEEFFGVPAGSPAIVDADGEIHQQIADDDDPVR